MQVRAIASPAGECDYLCGIYIVSRYGARGGDIEAEFAAYPFSFCVKHQRPGVCRDIVESYVDNWGYVLEIQAAGLAALHTESGGHKGGSAITTLTYVGDGDGTG